MAPQVLDCTIRDGGLMNRWKFDDAFVTAVVNASRRAGSRYVELGYRASETLFDPAEHGAARFCREDWLRSVWEPGDAVLAVMVDVGRLDIAALADARDSVVGAIRVAAYAHQAEEAVETARALHEKGYETFVNIMAVSEAAPSELDRALERIGDSPARAVYVVDSYGNLTPTQTQALVRRYAQRSGKDVGFHGHNNLQLALANSLAAAEAGAAFLDASLAGMGRGAGNTPLELLLPQLGSPLAALEPLFSLLETEVPALRRSLRWGYEVPYIVAGLANQHPREAMALMDEGRGAVESGYLARLAAC